MEKENVYVDLSKLNDYSKERISFYTGYLQSNLKGYLRCGIEWFPSYHKFGHEKEISIAEFERHFLPELMEAKLKEANDIYSKVFKDVLSLKIDSCDKAYYHARQMFLNDNYGSVQ